MTIHKYPTLTMPLISSTSFRMYRFGRAAYRMVNIEESFARGQLVALFNFFQSSNCQEHADRRTQGKEIHWLKVQSVVDHRHLQSKAMRFLLVIISSPIQNSCNIIPQSCLPVQSQLQSNCSWRGRRRQCCRQEASSRRNQEELQLPVEALQPDWPLWPPLSSPAPPDVQPAYMKPTETQRGIECWSCKPHSHSVDKHTCLFTLSLTNLAIFFRGPSGIPISFRSSIVHISWKKKKQSEAATTIL